MKRKKRKKINTPGRERWKESLFFELLAGDEKTRVPCSMFA